MEDSNNINKNNNIKNFLLKTAFDPVLIYTVVIMMSIMYHYRDSLTIVYGIASYIIGWAVFRFFDYMYKHNFIGGVGYVILLIGFMRVTRMCIEKGQESYPLSWGVWFLTPQDAVDYNSWYTLSMFLLFQLFMMTVIYYFNRVRYRIFMNFLIFIIPFAIYGKEYEKMPVRFIILIAVGYIFMMIYFRSLRESENVTVVRKKSTWKSTLVYIALFAVISTVIPKPEIEADRTVLETLISAEQFTDRLVAMLNVFQDSTGGEQFRTQNSNMPIYFAESGQPLRLKTRSFSYYDYETDSWSVSDLDTEILESNVLPLGFTGNGDFYSAVLKAAQLDSDFAEKYGLEEFTGMEFSVPEPKKVNIYTVSQRAEFAPVPQSAVEFLSTSYDGWISMTTSGLARASGEKFSSNERFSFSYYPDGFMYNEKNRAFVDALGKTDYSDLLWDTAYILGKNSNGDDELGKLSEEASFNYIYYDTYRSRLVDYGDNQKIYDLANQITAGLESDFEKAKALEIYFYQNGYKYDLEYQKSEGENVEDFIFESKTGVCYEYATAMTLMARACGIPARYCEGFNMQQRYTGNTYRADYVVTSQDAHGFPELYIKGYGWMSFEPTISDAAQNSQERETTGKLSQAGLFILALLIVVFLGMLFYPEISHRIFVMTSGKKSVEVLTGQAFRRICKIYGIEKFKTSQESEQIVKNTSGADISQIRELFDRVQYGGESLDENCRKIVMESYNSARNSLRETKRQKRKFRHENRRNTEKTA